MIRHKCCGPLDPTSVWFMLVTSCSIRVGAAAVEFVAIDIRFVPIPAFFWKVFRMVHRLALNVQEINHSQYTNIVENHPILLKNIHV